MKEQVQAILDKIRPAIQADGGDVEFVDFNDDTKVVTVRLTGSCVGCPMSQLTLKAGIERIIKEHIPGITSVEAAM